MQNLALPPRMALGHFAADALPGHYLRGHLEEAVHRYRGRRASAGCDRGGFVWQGLYGRVRMAGHSFGFPAVMHEMGFVPSGKLPDGRGTHPVY